MLSTRRALRFTIVVMLASCLQIKATSQWVAQPVPAGYSVLLSVSFTSPHNGVIGGYAIQDSSIFQGGALYTTNGGATWEPARVPDSARALVSVQMFGDGTGYCAGAYNLPTVGKRVSAIPSVSLMARSGAAARRARLLQIGLDWNDSYRGLFLKTTDGGQSWVSWGTLPDSTYYLTGMYFMDARTGFVASSMTHLSEKVGILKTVNGGMSWSRCLVLDSVAQLRSIHFVDSTGGYAVGFRIADTGFTALVLRTTDRGQSWTSKAFNDVDNFQGVWCIDTSTAFAAGTSRRGDGTVYRTTNGGATWSSVAIGTDSMFFQGICFSPGAQTGLVYGSTLTTPSWSAFASRSTDGGGHWQPAVLPEADQTILISGISLDDNNAYLVGGNPYGKAVIFHTTNGGATSVQGTPTNGGEQCRLMQNYPNPFNPSTMIEYELTDRSHVRIAVYNTLGQEVAVLEDGAQDAGYHEVRFDGSSLPSGVYLYRLQAGNTVRSRKLVLLK